MPIQKSICFIPKRFPVMLRNICFIKSALHLCLTCGIPRPPLSLLRQTVSFERTFLAICPFPEKVAISFSNITVGGGRTLGRYHILDNANVLRTSAF